MSVGRSAQSDYFNSLIGTVTKDVTRHQAEAKQRSKATLVALGKSQGVTGGHLNALGKHLKENYQRLMHSPGDKHAVAGLKRDITLATTRNLKGKPQREIDAAVRHNLENVLSPFGGY